MRIKYYLKRYKCQKAGMTLDQVSRPEINMAFFYCCLDEINRLQLDRDKVNVNLGAISIGYSIGTSGGRRVATFLQGREDTGGR